jgi:ketosteroid isomerase-like protein
VTAVPDALTDGDERELRALAADYAAGVDRRDQERLLSVFTPDGVLERYDAGVVDAPRAVIRGHEELARITERIASYDATFHFIGQATYRADADGAVGEVYCTARHLTRSRHGATDFTMFIRYVDRYARGADGRWRITLRKLFLDWTELHTAIPPAGVRPPAS